MVETEHPISRCVRSTCSAEMALKYERTRPQDVRDTSTSSWRRRESCPWILSCFIWCFIWHESWDAWVLGDPKIDAATWNFYVERGDIELPEQSCIEGSETFSAWIRRQMNSSQYTRLARFVDKSSAKHYAITRAPYITTAQTIALFTRRRLRALRTYNFPDSFAFKAVHGSGMNLLVANRKVFAGNKGKYSRKKRFTGEEMKQLARSWLVRCYSCDIEPQYKYVRRAVIIEEFLGENLPYDYQLFMFGGRPFAVQVRKFEEAPSNSTGSRLRARVHQNRDRTPLTYVDLVNKMSQGPAKPPHSSTVEKMFNAGIALAQGFRFIRVDFYVINETVHFGEMTLSPMKGSYRLDGFFNKEHLKKQIGICVEEADP